STGGPYSSLASVGFGINRDGTVSFDDTAFQTAAKSNYGAVAALLAKGGSATNASVQVTATGTAPPGTYAVNVASNANGIVTGTVNGFAASGTGGELIVNAPGSIFDGLALQIGAGVTGDLGSVTVSSGLFGSLSNLVTAALATGTGSINGQISGLNS